MGRGQKGGTVGPDHVRRCYTCKQRHPSLGISQHQLHRAQTLLLKLQSAHLGELPPGTWPGLLLLLLCSPISQLMSDPTRLSITPFSSIRWPILSMDCWKVLRCCQGHMELLPVLNGFHVLIQTHPLCLYPAFCPRRLSSVDHINGS